MWSSRAYSSARCSGVTPDDVEGSLEAIRIFQRTAIFRIAIADRLGSLPLMKVSDRLTDTAELVLEHALGMAWRELVAKYGTPFSGPPPREVGFAVIGYGKLGGLELGYGSDLDLVFLNDSRGAQQETNGTPPLDNERFFTRLVQRLVHFLTIQTSSGRLYDVDTRLRPSGRAGLLVSGIDGFYRYQKDGRVGLGASGAAAGAARSSARAASATSSSGCAATCSWRTCIATSSRSRSRECAVGCARSCRWRNAAGSI